MGPTTKKRKVEANGAVAAADIKDNVLNDTTETDLKLPSTTKKATKTNEAVQSADTSASPSSPPPGTSAAAAPTRTRTNGNGNGQQHPQVQEQRVLVNGVTNLAGSNNNDSSSNNNNNIHENGKQHVYINTVLADRASLHADVQYQPLSLIEIHNRIHNLCRRVPPIPPSGFLVPMDDQAKITTTTTAAADAAASSSINRPVEKDHTLPVPIRPCPVDKIAMRAWATQLQTVLEELHLLIALITPANYCWGTDRSGAADQNLSLLSQEMVRSQEILMARVTPRLNDVLSPVVTVVNDKIVTTKTKDGVEIKQNYWCTTQEDPDYVDLCHVILARNAVLLRQLVLANLDKLLQAIKDFIAAKDRDSQHDSRGFVY